MHLDKKLQNVFSQSNKIQKLISLLKMNILSKNEDPFTYTNCLINKRPLLSYAMYVL